MKPYSTYQALQGEPMTARDKREIGSKYWNEGKWENFVRPFLPQRGDGMTLIDMGCNAGLFLKMAEDMGFNAIGVDSSSEAVERGRAWRDKQGGKYQLLQYGIENCIDTLPMADYTVLANAHYYFTVNDWLEYVDKLQYKTRYVIIVTDDKRHLQRCWASADISDIRSVFQNWDEVGYIPIKPNDNDPGYRRLSSICFKSPFIERVAMDELDSSNHVQDEFWGEIDKGNTFETTRYYRILKKYRKDWEPGRLDNWMRDRIRNYESIKREGLRTPLIIERNMTVQKDREGNERAPSYRILDGNHRCSGLKHLGFTSTFVRKV